MRYLRHNEVLARVGVAAVTLWRWEKMGHFPKRRKLGPRLVGWDEGEIDNWHATRGSSDDLQDSV